MINTTAQLSWKPIATKQHITYKIQRKASAAPISQNDGVTIGEVHASFCADASVPSGIPWYYAVFAIRDGVTSIGAATSGPHLSVSDPVDLVIQAGNTQVTLQWTRPQGCTAIEVWRNQGNPPALGKGTNIVVTSDSIVDQGLQNGVNYGYFIVACFPDPVDRGAIIRSPGISVTATPVDPAPAVTDLRARREDRTIILTWTPPQRGEVQIRQTRQKIMISPGQIIALATADRFGTPIPITGHSTTQTAVNGQGMAFFIPLSVIEQTAVLGTVVTISTIDEVTNVRTQRSGNTINLTWNWPVGAVEVLVAWRYDVYPTKPNNTNEESRLVKHAEYARTGTWELNNATRKWHYFTLFVHDPNSNLYSNGTHILEASGLESQVRYQVQVKRHMLRRTIEATWVELSTSADLQILPAIKVILNKRLPAISPQEGQVIATANQLTFRDGVARIDLPSNDLTGYIKLFFEDGAHAREIRLLPAETQYLQLG